MIDTLFQFFMKFKWINFEEGYIVFERGASLYLFMGVLLFLALSFITIYIITNIFTSNRSRAVSISLRLCALIVLCIPFLEPMLMIPDLIPNENFLAVLVDSSSSMSIADGYFGSTRFDDARTLLFDKKNGILSELEKTFNIRYYKFSSEVSRADTSSFRKPDGNGTNISVSLQRVLSDFKGLPLTGVLLFTDGGDNSADDARSAVEELRSLDIPLHIVGLGNESFEQEREILDITSNRQLLEGTGADITVKVKSWNKERDPVMLSLYKGNKLVYARDVLLQGNGNTDVISLNFNPEENDVSEYTMQLAVASNEVNVENNMLDLLIDSRRDSLKILYLEGYLHSDFKFIKRALADDRMLKFTSASITGTGKYYRQGIDAVDQLQGGFPASEDELYNYKAVILGDIEANYFSIEQLALIEKFVSKRGGGFLMLGGHNSFAEGYFWNTPIADLLPVEIDQTRRMAIMPDFTNPNAPREEQGFKFVPTRAGLEYPILKLAEDTATNKMLWDEMPRLLSINYLGQVKPGATVLAEKPADNFGVSEPLLVIQRYGKGRTAALATASTWRWQMLLDEQDTRHERFWRQFARWLCVDTPDNVNIELTENRFEPDTELPIRVSVYDKDYNPLVSSDVTGIVTDPFGDIHELQFLPELTEDGVYVSDYTLQDTGIYTIEVTADQNSSFIGKQHRSILSYPSKKEYYDAVLKRDYLEHLAGLNGGIYYEPSEANVIPENVRERRTGTSVYRNEYLWDSPLLFLLAVILLSAEWIYRRNKGLP